MKQIAIVGGGWAGCAAAVELTVRGHQVHLLEASRILGGRARGLDPVLDSSNGQQPPDTWEAKLDNGQHILLGAYRETLRLMRIVDVDLGSSLLRLPLQMRYPAGCNGIDFLSAHLPAPWHVIAGLWHATGLTRSDKMALARFTTSARWIDWRLNQDCSVTELLDRFNQPPRVTALLWRPLCLAALNTPPQRASAQIFLNVLRDSLGARRAASDMLIPRIDLTNLFPQPAARFLVQHGARLSVGMRVKSIHYHDAKWYLRYGTSPSQDETAHLSQRLAGYDALILATPVAETRRLIDAWGHADTAASVIGNTTAVEASDWLTFPHMTYEPITTCYLQYPSAVRLPLPFYALIDDPLQHRWGQFVFDRGQLDVAHSGLLAVVISASAEAITLTHEDLCAAIGNQLEADFKNPALGYPLRVKVISEKRATFSCHAGLLRPPNATRYPCLVLAGDFVSSDYPATLEAAVQSGVQAANLLIKNWAVR